MARKPALKRLASSAGTAVTAAGAAPLANGRQVHTVTFQPGRNASCEPVEVGPGYASEAFRYWSSLVPFCSPALYVQCITER